MLLDAFFRVAVRGRCRGGGCVVAIALFCVCSFTGGGSLIMMVWVADLSCVCMCGEGSVFFLLSLSRVWVYWEHFYGVFVFCSGVHLQGPWMLHGWAQYGHASVRA